MHHVTPTRAAIHMQVSQQRRKQLGGQRMPSRRAVIEAWGSTCHICGMDIDVTLPGTHSEGLHREHVVALADGGSNHIDNVKPAHKVCNLTKGIAGQRKRYTQAELDVAAARLRAHMVKQIPMRDLLAPRGRRTYKANGMSFTVRNG